MSKGLLDGIVVLDLTRVLAGPYCSMLLADMGATVIKIEIPRKGDDSRAFGPFLNGESTYYMNLNRNKLGVTLNLKTQEGKEIFKEMVKKGDVVLENYRPGTMEKLGLGYDTLKEINPSIVYGCISGFGHYGPYSQRAGYDIIAQAMGGLMSTTGWPGGKPTRTGTAMGDVLGGLGCAIGVLAAVINKMKTGEGQKVDVALVDSVVSSLEIITQIYLASGRIPERIGNRYESAYPYDSFKAKDGDVIIGCGNQKLFVLLCEAMEMPELLEDDRFKENTDRVKNNEALKMIIEEWTSQFGIDEIVDMLLDKGIPSCPINTIDRVVKDPHIAGAREMFVEVEHPVAGKMKITGNHIKFDQKKVDIKVPAPTLGQDNYKIYGELLGLSEQDIDSYIEKGVF
ncbi:CaiB/BaiF CoA transferase family protein [Clostridium sp. Cult2]|uniref:CaiB/BaiF CoA transferase family protein n=1 Tax=Clostridium sp. Cult2 TaxID=2079003 RepID=UPI001F3137CA|nr:CoA transferase [Clostridium sp. Cult2]MCF6466050.1 carnitine dehydratase [Clostridium sp. Cult2]